MNKEYIIYNLREAQEEIEETIQNLETDTEYEFGDYIVAMSHLYHHINTAWNARDAGELEVEECSENNFAKWRKMPSTDELFLHA